MEADRVIPNGFCEFCAARGISEFHPSTWSISDNAAFIDWKLAAFRARWRAAIDNGDVERTRRQNGREYLLRRVREDVEGALAPAPSDTYLACPCHPSVAWRSPQGSVKEPRTPMEIVAWLTEHFAPGTAQRRLADLAADLRTRTAAA